MATTAYRLACGVMNEAAGNEFTKSHSPQINSTEFSRENQHADLVPCEILLRQPRPIPACLLPVLILITLFTGTGIVLLQKYMNRQSVPTCADCPPRNFASPMGQTLAMFAGQSLTLIVFGVDLYIVRKRGGVQGHLEFPGSADSMAKPHIPKLYWMLPCLMDLIGSTLCNVAFTITFVSTVQVLRNSNVVMCAILQFVYLRRPLTVHEWLGVLVITLSMIMTGVYGIVTSDPSSQIKSSLSWLGVLFAILGTAFISFQMIYEEQLMRRFYASPVAAVGWQGLFGVALSLIGVLVVHLLGFENVKETYYQVTHSSPLLTAALSYFFGVAVFNGAGMSVTKLTGAVLKSILYAVRSAMVWLSEFALGWNAFDWLNFGGLFFLAIGFMIFAHCDPFPRLHRYHEIAIRELHCGSRKEAADKDDDDQSTISALTTGSSPPPVFTNTGLPSS